MFGGLDLWRFSGRCDLPPERRDFDGLRAELHVSKPEATADNPAVAKKLLDLVRMRRRPDIEVLGPSIQQQIANASPDEICDVVMFVKPIEDFQRVGIDAAA